jgi:hypothetical protein
MKWKPIETAPRDGTYFLAYDLKSLWRDRPPVAVVHFDDGFEDRFGYIYTNLTHWCELPEPPKE